MSHADAEAGLLQEVGRPAHALHPARDDDVGLTQLDRLRRQHDGLQPGAARLVDGVAPDFLRDAGLEGGHPPRIEAEPGRKHVPEDDFLHLGGLELRSPRGFPHGDGAELRRRKLGEGAAERSDRGAGRCDDDGGSHMGPILLGGTRRCNAGSGLP